MKTLVLNPSSNLTNNVIRDVLYGCWCKGKRIGGASIPPYSLLSVATVLDAEGLDVCFLDAQAEKISWDEICRRAQNADAVVISTSTMTVNEDAELIRLLKKCNSKILSLAFGSHPTFLSQDTLSKGGIDICVRHDPEFIIRDVLKRYFSLENGDWQNVNGISFRDANGNVVNNPPDTPINSLDQLPFLKTEFLPPNIDYFNPIVRKMPYITTITSRGCPAECTFCTVPYFYGKRIRVRSEQGVINEIKHYLRKGYREIYFRDETFTFSRKRTLRICYLLRENGLSNTPWICNARIGTVDREILLEMKNSGCHFIKFGIESGVQEILDGVKKGTQVSEIRRTFRWLNELGIESHAHCMLGMPGETRETMKRTIDFVKEINPTSASWTITTPYPGSALYDQVKKKYPEIGDGTDTDLSKLHTSGIYNHLYTELSGSDIEYEINKAVRSFYLRPSYWFKTAKRIRSMNDIKRFTIAGLNVIDFSVFGD